MSWIGLHKLAILFLIILSITRSGTGFERQNKVIFVKAFFFAYNGCFGLITKKGV